MKKIRTISVVLVSMLLVLSSCDSTTVDFDTNLYSTIVAEIQAPAAASEVLKSEGLYSFETEKKLYIKDTKKINDYIDRINEIAVNSISCSFSSMVGDQKIVDLSVFVDNIDLEVTLEDINNGFEVTLDIDIAKLEEISNLLLDNQEITIKVNGHTNFAPMTFTTILDFAVTVSADVLD